MEFICEGVGMMMGLVGGMGTLMLNSKACDFQG